MQARNDLASVKRSKWDDASLIAELEPSAAGLLDRHIAAAREWFPHQYVPWSAGRNFDGPLEAGSGYAHILAFEALVGVGSGLVAPVATELVLTAVPAAKSGLGSALNDATRQVGSTLGVAVLGSILATVFTARIEDRLQAHPAAQVLLRNQEGRGLLTRAGHPGADTASVLVQETGAAFVHGMSTAAIAGAGAALLAAVLSWRKLPASDRPPDRPPPPRAAAQPPGPVAAGPFR
ncbi:hypothetical protein SBADM41S_11793 [Streptomyces badius]